MSGKIYSLPWFGGEKTGQMFAPELQEDLLAPFFPPQHIIQSLHQILPISLVVFSMKVAIERKSKSLDKGFTACDLLDQVDHSGGVSMGFSHFTHLRIAHPPVERTAGASKAFAPLRPTVKTEQQAIQR